MNKIISAIKLTALCTLAFIGIFCIFSEPTDDSQTWLFGIIISKFIGLAAFYALFRLFPRWARNEPWLKAYVKFCNKALD